MTELLGPSMRLHLMGIIAHLCRVGHMSWPQHDAFVDRTDHHMGDAEILAEAMMCCGTDFIRVMRMAMNLEAI